MIGKNIELSSIILDIAAGPFGSKLKVSNFVEKGFPIIDGANLKSFKVTDNITKFVTKEKATSLYRSIAKRRDVVVTISGTLLGLIIMSTYAYALSRRSFAYRKFFTKLIFIPMLFSGGMVSSYLVMVNFLHLKNNILALILPLCVSSFNIIILRTFFKTSVPEAVIESARIDGASELKLFIKIVLPIAIPGIATIGLFLTLAYWNDWFNAMLYIEEPNLIPLQYMLIKIETSMEFLVKNAASIGASAIEASKNMPTETLKMAIVVITTLPIMFAYPFFQKYFVNGLTIGAVKE